MTVSFLQHVEPAPPLSMQHDSPAYCVCPQGALPDVGERRVSSNALTPAQRESAIRKGLAMAAECEARAQHYRRLVAQLKGETQ